MNLHARIRLGALILHRKRKGFDPQWGEAIEHAAREALAATDFDVIIAEGRVCDDGSLRAALARIKEADADALVVLQPIMADGRLAPVISQRWGRRPLVLWATTERHDSDRVSSCSLVGAHSFASIFRQLGQPFEIVYGDPAQDRTRRDLDLAVRLTYAARRLRCAKVGLVGYHAPGFINVHADPFALSRGLGAELHHLSIHEFADMFNAVDEATIKADVAETLALGIPCDGITNDDLAASSRYFLAMKHAIATENLDALALRCWPELRPLAGSWPYFAIARLTDEGESIAVEGDVEGAISSLVARLLGFGPSFLSDWLEHDRETITLWHIGAAPFPLCEPLGAEGGPRVGRHFNDGNPAVVNATLAAGQAVTVFRLWRCDDAYHATAADAETMTPGRNILGTSGVVRLSDRDVREWFDDLCHAGMPHHLILFAGQRAEALKRFSRLAGVQWMA